MEKDLSNTSKKILADYYKDLTIKLLTLYDNGYITMETDVQTVIRLCTDKIKKFKGIK